MNHLKHIRGINVSCHIPSNVALPSRYGQQTDVYLKNRQFRSQVSRLDQLAVAKKNYDVDIKYSKQFHRGDLRLVSKGSKTICKQRSRTKSSVTSLKKKSSMDKKLPLESLVGTVCHYSTCQNVKFNSGFNKRHKSQIVAIINGVRNINHHGSFAASVEKYPRSYAEMIADYSEALHKVSTVGVRNDSLYFDNTIRKSPFSTFSTPSSVKKIVNVTEYNGVPIEGQENYPSLPNAIESFGRRIQHDNVNTVECHDSQRHDTCIEKTINKVTNQDCIITNDMKNDDDSYAKLVADCSKSMRSISLSNISNGGLASSKNVLTKNSLQSFVTPRKANSTNIQETVRKTSLSVTTIPLEKNVKEQLAVPKKHNWLKEIESVTNELKSAIEKGTARAVNISKLKENNTSQFVDAFDNSLHKVHRLTKLIKAHKQKEKDTAVQKLDYQSDKINKMEKRNKDFALQKHNYSQLIDKIPTTSSARKNSTHVPTSGTTSVLKQPQVKLRMVPSAKESVVSINVDSISKTGSVDPLNPVSKQLSVVVQSDRKDDPQSTENQWNVSTLRGGAKSAPQRNDFGPMRISISEDSAPIKQIEFSINGKPVSELKSITARTERLDVVSSMDKIEIRIPFAKDDASAPSKTRETDPSKETDSRTGQILNVQISANFQNESAKSSVEKSRETPRHEYDKDTTSAPPKSYYLFNEFTKAREDTFSNNKYEFSDQIDTKSDNTKKMMSTIRSPTNKYDGNESSDHRVPSKIIPWWSSSDSFNKIKKKEENPKPIAPSTRNEKKAISNLNHNLATGSLPSKWKETSNSTTQTKNIQSINDVTINNSSNLTSYLNSVEQYVKVKPTLHYSHSFRLKPNKGNPDTISDMRNDLKIKDNQMSVVQEDKKNFGIIPTRPVPLSVSDATNIGKHDVNIKEKTSLLQKETLNNAKDLQLKRNREKKDNYFLKQTKSIDDVFSTNSKINNILNALKQTEKRKSTLIDDLKPTVKLNNRAREIQNSPAGKIISKDLMSNTSVTEMKEQVDKTIKQTKLEKAETLEIKMDILKQKKNLIEKNVATSNVKLQNKNDINNIQHQNDVKTTSSSNLKNSLKSTQVLKKQEKSAEDTIIFQDNQKNKKSSLENSKDKPRSSSSMKISSGTIKKSEKLGMSVKILSEESKQDKPKNLSKNTLKTIQEIEKLRSSTSPQLENNLSKKSLDKKMINQKTSPLEITNEIKYNINTNKITNQSQINSKPKINSKVEDCAISKNLMEKNAKEIPDKFVKKIDKKDNAENKTAIAKQNLKSKDPLPKNCEKNHLDKSGKNKRNSSESAGFLPRKPNSISFKSADSKTRTIVTSNDNGTYERKSMLMEPLYPNFNKRDDTVLNSQSAIVPRNLHNDMLEHRASRTIGNAGPWINTDRPEKSMLYSVWLQ